ncbi:MAG TPA: DUF2804 domain-containing protein [Bacillota bacterium]|jgi:hypothetical protein
MERELTVPVFLCDSRGNLNPEAVGWSRRPLHDCNLSAHWPRKKRWDYWCVTSDEYLFSVTLSNLDYAGLAFVYFHDFAGGRFIEKTVMKPLGAGCALGRTVGEPVRFEGRGLRFSIEPDPAGASVTRIRVESPDFGGLRLAAALVVEHPAGHETMNAVIPWSRSRFQFTSKHQALPAEGVVTLGGGGGTGPGAGTALEARFPAGSSFACLDFGRGVWPYSSAWNWASFSALVDGLPVGVNLGGRWTDGTGYTENAIVAGGRLSKLPEKVTFAYDPRDFIRPWSIRTEGSERVDLLFEPFYERIARSDLLVVRSEIHQMIGRFSGTLAMDDGRRIAIDKAVGCTEDHRARW